MNKKTNWQKTVKQVGTLIILLLLLTLLPSQSVYAATITVNSTADTVADDGQCTLREAITNANNDAQTFTTSGECATGAGAGVDTINLGSNLTYSLAITGVNDNNNVDGDLDIIDDEGLTIIGNNSIIESNINDRVFHIISGATATIQDVTIQNGHFNGSGNGGGILNDGELIISNSTITNNNATSGAGIYNDGTLTINNSVVSSNIASSLACGIYNNGPLVINESTISNNNCTGIDGGGIRNFNSLTLNRSTISNNTGRRGAGIRNQSGTLTINNSTISNNNATQYGGGLQVQGGVVIINNSTIAYNSANDNGGGIYNEANTVNIKNTIIAKNTASSNPDCHGTLTSNGYNLIENNSCGMVTTTGDIIGSDPMLNGLTNNGGPTDTHELQGGSPAIDTGGATCMVSEDQRGGVRPQDNGCDIGSYEVGALAVDLASFTATNQGAHLRLEWATVSESNNLGFNLYRNTSAEFPEAEPLNSAIIEAIGPGSGSGFTYEYEDHDIVLGTTYHYWLVDIDVGGNETRHGPISIDYDNIPTSVRMTDFESHKPSNLSWLVMLTVLGMTIGAISMQRRQ